MTRRKCCLLIGFRDDTESASLRGGDLAREQVAAHDPLGALRYPTSVVMRMVPVSAAVLPARVWGLIWGLKVRRHKNLWLLQQFI